MSYWIYLENKNGEVIDTDAIRSEGGTCVLGGQSEAELNVTYNYSKHFNFRQLDGMSAKDALIIMRKAMEKLGDDENSDYWKPTEGNVKRAIGTLIEFVEYAVKNKIEDTVFRVS